MDDRNGNLYEDKQAGLDAGVPAEHLVEVGVVTVKSGPFKGRHYIKHADGTTGRRVLDKEFIRLRQAGKELNG
jgi:hypothetical protein